MKFYGAALIVFLSFSWLARAQQLSIANLTTCGLECLEWAVPQANCTLADADCQCSSTSVPQLTSGCLFVKCSMHDSLVFSKFTASVCHYPHSDRSQAPFVATVAIVTITSIFILLRLLSKRWVSGSVEAGDWIIAYALLLFFVKSYSTIKLCSLGLGRHMWNLNDGDLSHYFENFYIGLNFYIVNLVLSKTSILAFYLRIFPRERFRYAAFGAIASTVISTVILLLVTVFSCHPIAFFWDKDLEGQCLDVSALAFANSGMSIAQDLIIITLPLPVLTKLNMSKNKKIGVCFMFAVGGFGCIRLKSIFSGSTGDPTWYSVDTTIWTALELAVAMICASLPALRNLPIHVWPRGFLTTNPVPSSKKSKRSGSRGWRSGPKIKATPDGLFVELEEAKRAQEALAEDSAPMWTALLPKEGVPSSVAVVADEVSVHSSPAPEEPASSV